MLDANPPDETIRDHDNTYPIQSSENKYVNINVELLEVDTAFLSSLNSAAGNNDDEGNVRKVLDILYLCSKDLSWNSAVISSSQHMALLSAIPELFFEVLHRINEKYYLVASWEWNGSKYVAKLHLHLRPMYVANGKTKLQCNATFQKKYSEDGSSKSGSCYPVFTYNLTQKLRDLLGDDVDTVLEQMNGCSKAEWTMKNIRMSIKVHTILGVLGIIFRRAHNPGLLFPNESEFADSVCQGLGSDLNVDGEDVPFNISHIRHDKTEVSSNIAEPASVNVSRFDYCTGYVELTEGGEVHRNPRCTHNPRCGMILKLYETRPTKKARFDDNTSLVIGVNARVDNSGITRRMCSRDGCANFVQLGGVCIKHGAKDAPKKIFNREGCTHIVQWRGVQMATERIYRNDITKKERSQIASRGANKRHGNQAVLVPANCRKPDNITCTGTTMIPRQNLEQKRMPYNSKWAKNVGTGKLMWMSNNPLKCGVCDKRHKYWEPITSNSPS